jgi:hypothetical protein
MRSPLGLLVVLSLVAPALLAATPIIAVYQVSEYAADLSNPQYPSGLIFEVCSDGSFFRSAVGPAGKSSFPEQGVLSEQTLERVKADLENRWLAPIRAECKKRGVLVDGAYLRIQASRSQEPEEFECTLYEPGTAVKNFEAMMAGLAETSARPAADRKSTSCK